MGSLKYSLFKCQNDSESSVCSWPLHLHLHASDLYLHLQPVLQPPVRQDRDAQQPLHLTHGQQPLLGALALRGSCPISGTTSRVSFLSGHVDTWWDGRIQLNIHANRKVIQSNTKTIQFCFPLMKLNSSKCEFLLIHLKHKIKASSTHYFL